MNGFQVLDQLRAAGLTVEITGDRIRLTPSSAVTNNLKAIVLNHKSELVRAVDLDHRIRLMAKRWRYTVEDLTETLELAARDPERWLSAVINDEQQEAEYREKGLLPRADA